MSRLARAACLACLLAGCGSNLPEPPLLFGPTRLRPGDTLRLEAWSTDQDGDSLQYRVVWGDGAESDWSRWYPSGERVGFARAYQDTGRFDVLARARDRVGEGGASGPLPVQVFDFGPYRPTRPQLAADTARAGDTLGCVSSAGHPLNERVALQFDWGDTLGDWSAYVRAGEWLRMRHSYPAPGTYGIRARARDTSGHVSGWSDSVSVLILAP
ncbi:MAG: hypothetical protein R6X12_06375 [bacterium]